MPEMTDHEAIEDMRQGETKGFEVLYWRYKARVEGFLKSPKYHGLEEPLAEEICDDVFFQFYKEIGKFKEKCSVLTWLCSLARSKVKDYWKNAKRLKRQMPEQQQLSLDEIDEAELSFELDMEALCYEKCVTKVLAKCQHDPYLQDCLTALILSVKGLSIKEIAAKIGRTENATAVFMTACRKKLKQIPELKQCWDDC